MLVWVGIVLLFIGLAKQNDIMLASAFVLGLVGSFI